MLFGLTWWKLVTLVPSSFLSSFGEGEKTYHVFAYWNSGPQAHHTLENPSGVSISMLLLLYAKILFHLIFSTVPNLTEGRDASWDSRTGGTVFLLLGRKAAIKCLSQSTRESSEGGAWFSNKDTLNPFCAWLLSNCGRGRTSLNQPRACSYLGCSKHAHNHSLTPVPATSPDAAPSQAFFPSKVTHLSKPNK